MTTPTLTAPRAGPPAHLPGSPDVDLDELSAVFERAARIVDDDCPDTVLTDRMMALTALRAAVEAVQAATEYAFARAHAAREAATGDVDPRRLERSIGVQIGLVNRASPVVGRNRMQVARDVRGELRRVSWPNRDQLQQSTAVVLIIVVVLGAFVWLWDTIFQFLAQQIFL